MTHHPDHEVELYREDDAYVVIVDLPEYDESAIDVRWHDNRLHVHAEDHSGERSRVYNRHVTVPKAVDPDGITATYEDDVLEVTLPIVEGERAPGKKIDVS